MKRLPLPSRGPRIALDFEGTSIEAFEGEPVACALVAAGERVLSRSVKYHRPRGPFCFAAACSHCLMRVDGVPNTFACRVRARTGMRVERQNAFPSAQVDVFGSIDWLFPRGLDHHAMFAGVPVAEQVMAKVARHLAGLGRLPDHPAPERAPAELIQPDVVIVGAGPAGLAAAQVLARGRVPFALLERETWLGGRLALWPKLANAPAIAQLSGFPDGSVRLGTTAIGLFDDERGRFIAAVQHGPQPRLVQIYARRFLLSHGGTATLPPFESNDLPGIYSARAASALVERWGVLPGTSVACVGTGEELQAVVALLSAAGAQLPLVLETAADAPPRPEVTFGSLVAAHGRLAVRAVSYLDASGRTRKVSCDGLVLAYPPAPAFELARQGGARVAFRGGGYAVSADAQGATAAPDVYVAGEIAGPCTAAEAAAAGERAATAVAQALR